MNKLLDLKELELLSFRNIIGLNIRPLVLF